MISSYERKDIDWRDHTPYNELFQNNFQVLFKKRLKN